MLGINAQRARYLENALEVYTKLNTGNLPIDTFLRYYFRVNRVASGSRAWIAEHVYEVQRWKGLIAHLSPKPVTWTGMLNTYLLHQRWRYMTGHKGLPPHLRCSFPEPLFERIERQYGVDKALEICQILNEEPVTYLRVNTLRSSRDKAYKSLLHKGVPVEKCADSPCGLLLSNKKTLLESPEYHKGLVEIQDLSSQICGLKVEAQPGEHVLDYCAGSGGKALIFGPQMENKGRIYLHDVNENLLLKAKRRLKRAGIRNYFIMDPNIANTRQYYGKMDCVVADVPCSGVGAFRRNPDRKWTFTVEQVTEYTALQRSIVDNALLFLKPGGRLVYITCSIFEEENELQVNYFCKRHGLVHAQPVTLQLPESRGMNGYFLAVLQREKT
ncbi:sun-family protein, putative [Babesia bigemina]|uniref:Sun-family protein, putative n=1 Tax=Babesia bigemina TaxID=5866 RepID=A0A061D894_BABBI|nr:sun-family protein, putative [Babesia bigemina]CDR93950.1 sun-family protein, putative [Babesia bigemina]|eukprot:XP_012766136.1 sun-family protein, putative [Babesia bigemina]